MTEAPDQNKKFGASLRALLADAGLAPELLAREIRISPKYIDALLADDFSVFGAKVYAQGVLKKILLAVRVEDHSSWMEALHRSWGPSLTLARARPGGSAIIRPMTYVTPARTALGIGGVALAGFLFLVGARLVDFTSSPPLLLEEPSDGAVVRQPGIVVRGRTEKESKLTINGRELTIDASGGFGERLELQPGLNRLEFLAENRFGKTSRIIRYVAAE
ncbi:MAG: helix-turn-helix domain-containing protein [Candidatus Sungbacteria bacterium]|uniref:Helix-turn-helix domain-containing protein n=1 Tax=Candidatus Sungiibacteriota bacterium TaxID=2750080 RepID=A0A932R1I1_9BACT|nr:helix-turn-helix domain-containing protein [Candidatus Sungbacteria bacterium]